MGSDDRNDQGGIIAMRHHRLRHRAVLAAGAAGLLAAAVTAAAVAQQQRPYTPGPQNIVLPADWATRFIRYSVVDHRERKLVRHIFINPEAFAALRAGEPLPYGSVVVLADLRARTGPDGNPLLDQQGRFIPEPGPWLAVNVQQKERGWGEGYGPEKRNGEWEYARFNASGSRNNASVEACFTCHLQNRARQDFTFTTWDYAQTRR
jgi:hemoglobin